MKRLAIALTSGVIALTILGAAVYSIYELWDLCWLRSNPAPSETIRFTIRTSQ